MAAGSGLSATDEYAACPLTWEASGRVLALALSEGRRGRRDRVTHRRRASHCFEECLVFRRERKLTVTVDSFQTVAPATRPHERPGHTPWKDHAARIGPEPFLRLRIQLVPQVLNRWLSHCFPSKQSVHGSGAGVAEASSSPQSMDFGARHRTRPVTYSFRVSGTLLNLLYPKGQRLQTALCVCNTLSVRFAAFIPVRALGPERLAAPAALEPEPVPRFR